MSKRKEQDLDVLGETHLPDDLFTNTDGLNWMMDTFPDLGKGLGVLDHETLGDSKLPPALPDGIVQASEDEFEDPDSVSFEGLGDISEISHEASLADLSWLELVEQDPERLPDNPVDNGIPELEEAWGVHRRTDGINLLPNLDREAVLYDSSLSEEMPAEAVSQADLNELLRSASRKVTAGVSFSEVAHEVAHRLGENAPLARKGMQQIKEDAGLIGRVFIRASNYPGCASGKWTSAVRKQAAGAAYLVKKKACGNCVQAQNGSCAIFKKQLVPAVPWEDATQRYLPLLEASGRKLASKLPAKEALRQAFKQAPVGLAPVGDVRPIQPRAEDQVSLEEARKTLASTSIQTRILETSRKEALAHVGRWRSKGLLSAQDVENLNAHPGSGSQILRAASRLISAAAKAPDYNALTAHLPRSAADYSGLGNDFRVQEASAEEAKAQILQIQAPTPISGLTHQKLVNVLDRWVREGILSQQDAKKLAHSSAEPRDVLRVGAALAGRARTAPYSGVLNDLRVPEVSSAEAWSMLRVAEDKNQKATEVVAAELARRTHAASRAGKKEATVRAKVAKVTQAIGRGLRGSILKNYIRKLITAEEIPLAGKLLDPVLKQTRALEDLSEGPKEYTGVHFERVASEGPKVAPGPGFREAERMLRWARRQMSEGFAGRDLDKLLEGRFASSVRTAAAEALRTLRSKHEGLAGQVYVDAKAYASKTGASGCEKGALIHRANSIPTVMQMSRCDSCVHRVAKADGTPVCSTYNKRLIASIGDVVENPKVYQKEALRLANGTDAENTAALFNAYDPTEFQLGEEGELDELVLEDAPSNEELGEVFFGGLEFE